MTISVTYLGVAGWQIEVEGMGLALDPYFSRPSLLTMLTRPLVPDRVSVARHMPATDAIFITHSHYDHIADVPVIHELTGGTVPIYVPSQGAELLKVLGIEGAALHVVSPDEVVQIGAMRLTALTATHRKVLGRIPSIGPLAPDLQPPLRTFDYRMDLLYSPLIEVEGLRLLVTSGIDAEPEVPADVLFVGADADDDRLGRILRAVQPSVVLPNHWDDMFIPVDQPRQSMRRPGMPLARVDMAAFPGRVRAVLPGVEVIVPGTFERVVLTE